MLHIGHDRLAERRRLQPAVDIPPHAQRNRPRPARYLRIDDCVPFCPDVPRVELGRALHGPHARHPHGLHWPVHGPGVPLESDAGLAGGAEHRGADGVAGCTRSHRENGLGCSATEASVAPADLRRFGATTRDDALVRRKPQRGVPAGLGHDRNESAGQCRQARREVRGPLEEPRGAFRKHHQGGPALAGRRGAHRQRRRPQRRCPPRGAGGASGARAMDHRRVFPIRRS
mmetsp:Transcript_75504/g.209788  ORF Transcript_75504/g.209788 Transcript_75504/m.209788 type:complete len:230 (+) Transcript_75504:696-1385(+)